MSFREGTSWHCQTTKQVTKKPAILFNSYLPQPTSTHNVSFLFTINSYYFSIGSHTEAVYMSCHTMYASILGHMAMNPLAPPTVHLNNQLLVERLGCERLPSFGRGGYDPAR